MICFCKIMKLFSVGISLLICGVALSAEQSQIFKSKDDIAIYSKNEIAFSDIGKIKDYFGILIQAKESERQLAQADIYVFNNEQKISIDQALCGSYTDKIFGSESETGLKVEKKINLFKTPTGQSCEILLKDNDRSAKIPYRYVIAGFVHGRSVALVWQLNSVTDEDKAKLKTFWLALR